MDDHLTWASAASLGDLGELTARWLEGKVDDHPCYGGSPDRETSEIASVVAALNRAGLVTDFSQPAASMIDGCGQRAAVSGFSDEATAKRVAAFGLSTDLIVFAFPPGLGGGHYVPITVVDYRPFTWAGRHDVEDLEHYRESCGDRAMENLESSWFVDVVDPKWGRQHYLWQQLRQAVARRTNFPFDVKPADPGLGTDFVW